MCNNNNKKKKYETMPLSASGTFVLFASGSQTLPGHCHVAPGVASACSTSLFVGGPKQWKHLEDQVPQSQRTHFIFLLAGSFLPPVRPTIFAFKTHSLFGREGWQDPIGPSWTESKPTDFALSSFLCFYSRSRHPGTYKDTKDTSQF